MNWIKKLDRPEKYIKTFVKWGGLGILMGVMGGFLGALFHHMLAFVTELRLGAPWLIFGLPVGGLISVGLYQLFRLRNNRGTNEIIDAVLDGHSVSLLIAPVIFLTTAITHLFGGSAGREGAALQLGGGIASQIGKWMKLNRSDSRVLTMSGMSAVFAGLFGTPLTACLFTLEFEFVGTIFSPALLPCYISSFTAYKISQMLGVHAEIFIIDTAYQLELGGILRYAVLAVLAALLGIVMCSIFHHAEHFASKHLPNPYIRIAVGAVIIVGMTLLVGDHRYNGAGMDLTLAAIGGDGDYYSFILKLLFTAVTLAAGFKGGEIVPTFCIGATFGFAVGSLLGIDPGFAAALGMIGLFCSVTNSPLTSIVLSVEMFSGTNLPIFALICVISFVLSGNSGLYTSQVIQFSKTSPTLKREVTKDIN